MLYAPTFRAVACADHIASVSLLLLCVDSRPLNPKRVVEDLKAIFSGERRLSPAGISGELGGRLGFPYPRELPERSSGSRLKHTLLADCRLQDAVCTVYVKINRHQPNRVATKAESQTTPDHIWLKGRRELQQTEAVTIYAGSIGLARAAVDSFHFSWVSFLLSLILGSSVLIEKVVGCGRFFGIGSQN